MALAAGRQACESGLYNHPVERFDQIKSSSGGTQSSLVPTLLVKKGCGGQEIRTHQRRFVPAQRASRMDRATLGVPVAHQLAGT